MLDKPILRKCENCGRLSEFSRLWDDVSKCSTCDGWEFLGDVAESSKDLYGEKYFSGDEYLDYKKHAHVHHINFTRKWDLLRRVSKLKPQSVVDIGCAYGFFIRVAQEQCPGGKFVGFDVDEKVIEDVRLRGIDARVIDGSLPEVLEFQPDLVTFWDAFEHIPQSTESIQRAAGWQKKGGLIALSTVDSGALIPSMRKQSWRQYHPPTHLHFPTRKSLALLLNDIGYKVLYHRSFGYYRAFEQYLPIASRFLPPSFSGFPVYLNLFDIQMIVGIRE